VWRRPRKRSAVEVGDQMSRAKRSEREMSRPMRGGALGLLISAFRLRGVVESSTHDVPQGTAKHAFNDHHDIGRPRHVHLLRKAVDGLFSLDYLVARGLTQKEATQHNDHVTQALDVVLVRWDQHAILANAKPERPPPLDHLVGLVFSIEVLVRLAAYEALYG